jgi:hypothetical protein
MTPVGVQVRTADASQAHVEDDLSRARERLWQLLHAQLVAAMPDERSHPLLPYRSPRWEVDIGRRNVALGACLSSITLYATTYADARQ